MTDIQSLLQTFQAHFGIRPEFAVRAPGRVNLIGEHTDYNDGFVLPAAITYDVAVVGRPRSDRTVRLYSVVFDQVCEFSLDRIERDETAQWSNYARGVASILAADGHALAGMDAVLDGTVPLRSGLSSSAATEVAFCLAFEACGGFRIDPVQRALLSQRAEREFVGVQCGIMDQMISSLGRAGHALFIDTRTLDHRPVPVPQTDVTFVIANTNKPRELVQSPYNERRAACEAAVSILRKSLPHVRALRDVCEPEFEALADRLPETLRKRARHVITENARVLRSVKALSDSDCEAFGSLMNASHDSLRDDYEVTGPELDALVEAARSCEGVFGSRMTGAGFGGCSISLVRSNAVERFQAHVADRYRQAVGLEASFYVCQAADGAGPVVLE